MPTLGVSVIVIDKGKVLLTKREDFEVWCLPGGGVDSHESVEEAAIREVYEETGLKIKLEKLVGVYSRPHWLKDGDHTVVFTAKVVGGRMEPDSSEVIDIGFFNPKQLPKPMIWWHEEQIRDAVNNKIGMIKTQHIQQPFGKGVSMQELYQLSSQSKLSRQNFFLKHFNTQPQFVSHPQAMP